MDSHFIPFVFIIFYTSFQLLGMNDAANIDIQPNTISEEAHEDIKISCTSDRLKDKAQDILLMQIGRKGEEPLAQIRSKNNSSHIQKTKSPNASFEVEGYLYTQASLSFLNVFLLKPTHELSGVYTCSIYYVELSTGLILDNAAETNLTIIKTDASIESLLKKVTFLENKVKVLENTSQKEKTDLMVSLLKRLDNLEKNDQEHSSQIKSLTTKEHAIEKGLELTNATLSQEVKNRLSDKKSMTSIISKVTKFEQYSDDHLTRIRELEKKYSAIERDLKNTKISQEVTNHQNDKATIISISKKISSLEGKNADQASKTKYLTEKDAEILKRLASIDNSNKIQYQNIKDLSDRFSSSVTPYLNELKRLKDYDSKLSSQINKLVKQLTAMDNVVSGPKKKPVTPKPKKKCVKVLWGACLYMNN